jgi:hypothetical protein
MTDELLRDLARIANYAAGLRRLVDVAQDSAPERSRGTDSSGVVSVVVGADGLPRSFHIGQGWPGRLPPEKLDKAVVEASQAAMRERLASWSKTLEKQGWQEEADDLRAHPPSHPVEEPQPATNPRSVDAVAEDMIRALDQVKDIAAATQPAQTGTGSDSSGKLTLTLSGTGLISCTVDAKWASNRTATMLMRALGDALAAARADLARPPEQPSPDLGALFAEALALLKEGMGNG